MNMVLHYQGLGRVGVGGGGKREGEGDNSHCSIDGFQQLHVTLSGC